jgi:GT2 family glycosyltransferase
LSKITKISGNDDFIIIVPTRNLKNKIAIDFLDKIKSSSFFDPSVIVMESSGAEFHFSKVMNEGINLALKFKPKYIALSNDDVRPLGSNWDLNLISKLTDNKLGFICPSLVNDKGVEIGPIVNMPSYDKVLLFTKFYKIIPLITFQYIKKINHFVINHHENKDIIVNKGSPLGIINSQPFSIFDSTLLAEIKGFDENFKNGCEDFDLSLRIYSLNYKIGLDKTTRFLNLDSATIGKGGFSILYTKDKKKLKQVENWKFLIKKFGKHNYNNRISNSTGNMIFEI